MSSSALAQVADRLPNTKGLKVEVARLSGYTSVAVRRKNQVLQLAKQTGRGHIYWLQLSVYEVPIEAVSGFQAVKPSQWAKSTVSMNGDNIVSAELAPTSLFRAIDVVYDHDLLVGSGKWRNRTMTRTFEVGGRMVVAECQVSVQYPNGGAQPPATLLAELRDQHHPECKAFMDGLKVSS